MSGSEPDDFRRTPPGQPQAGQNALLAALAPDAELTAAMVMVELGVSDVVHDVGRPVEDVLFPLSCVVSLSTVGDADTADVATVGREGLVGLAGLLGASTHDTLAVCRVPGAALRLPIALARELLADDAAGLSVLHQYVRASMADLRQRVVCTRAHGSEQRCACWLLRTQDRVGGTTFALTHATLATMLGVRRATVSEALAGLQRRGILRSRRGTVTVLRRAALEAASCDCYATAGSTCGSPPG